MGPSRRCPSTAPTSGAIATVVSCQTGCPRTTWKRVRPPLSQYTVLFLLFSACGLRLPGGEGGRAFLPGEFHHLRLAEERGRLVRGRHGRRHRPFPRKLCRTLHVTLPRCSVFYIYFGNKMLLLFPTVFELVVCQSWIPSRFLLLIISTCVDL